MGVTDYNYDYTGVGDEVIIEALTHQQQVGPPPARLPHHSRDPAVAFLVSWPILRVGVVVVRIHQELVSHEHHSLVLVVLVLRA